MALNKRRPLFPGGIIHIKAKDDDVQTRWPLLKAFYKQGHKRG